MAPTDWITNYRRYLKRRNDSPHTLKNYMTSLGQFLHWLDEPCEEVTARVISHYIDVLMARGLRPKTINCHLERIRQFYHYLIQEEDLRLVNPVKKGYGQRMSKPLPRHLTEEELSVLFRACKGPRDRAMFMLMLRCGLRVGEVAALSLGEVDLGRRRLIIHDGKGRKDRVVYISDDALLALDDYLTMRPESTTANVFLVEKGSSRNQPLSVRGIQKRIEYYAQKTGLRISCHSLRHTMATQMLNADAAFGNDPGPFGPPMDHHHATLLPHLQQKSPEGLLQGYGGGYAKNRIYTIYSLTNGKNHARVETH